MGEFCAIAHVQCEFTEKFGIPRQSGIVKNLRSRIVFEQAYRSTDAVRGLEASSHIWLIWGFSENEGWSPTVRPPRLGGNERMGVFATRSPFRPNPIGLSCVKLERIDLDSPDCPVLHVLGADLMDGTPIYDIKPYVPYADCLPEATSPYAPPDSRLEVVLPDELVSAMSNEQRSVVSELLAQDPRPPYHDAPERVYGMEYGSLNVRFRVSQNILTVVEITERNKR